MSTWMYAIVFRFLLRFVFIYTMNVHMQIWGMGVPLFITVVSCIMICIMKKRSQSSLQRRPKVHQGNKLIKTILVVVVVFLLSWLPHTIVSVTVTFSCSKGKCYHIPLLNMFFLKFLYYSNSFANPIIYAFRIDAFRSQLLKMFRSVGTAPNDTRVSLAISQMPHGLELGELTVQIKRYHKKRS